MRMFIAVVALVMAWPVFGGEPELGVMTFNIRYGTADDGPDAWPNRRELVIGLIEGYGMDVVGLQEALRFQLDEIEDGVPQYAVVGVGRDDGQTKGEYSAILYKRDRFTIGDCGTFWLSDTPEETASTSWGNSITRICTWARLIEKDGSGEVLVYNTHFDHRSQESRERSAELIATRIAADRARWEGVPVVLMGDFNSGEDNAAIQYLWGKRESASGRADAPASPRLVDTFRRAHPDATEVGSFSGFKPDATTGDKIDHVMVSAGVEVADADVDRTVVEGRCPSDHFPVWAKIRIGD